MEFLDYECKLLYKQNLETWLEEKNRTKKFSVGDLEFVKTLQQKYRFKYDENESGDEYDWRDRFCLNGRFGFVYFTEPDLILFSFTELDETKTLFHLSLEVSNVKAVDVKRSQNGDEEDEFSGNENPESIELESSAAGYQKVYLQNLIKGSNYGNKILAYADEGHVFLIDLETKIGKLVAKWPVDPEILASAGKCYGIMPYNPDIRAAVNGDYSLVAVAGPSEGEPQIRIFNIKNKNCSLKTLKLSPGLLGSKIHMICFNPYHSELLYVSLFAKKSQYNSAYKVNDSDSNDDNDDDDDDLAFVLFDTSTEQVLAEVFGISLIPMAFFYDTIGSVKFLKQGSVLLTYKVSMFSSNRIVFIDAFHLKILGSVELTGLQAVLGDHTVISSCQSEFAIFKCKNLDSLSELEYDVEVYKIPGCDISLKNFCRKAIIEKVNENQIDSLSLPNTLKAYLKL